MTRRALVGLTFALAGFLACSDDPAPAPPNGTSSEAGVPDESLVTTSEECTPGTRAAVGGTTCVPVGTTTCAAGFVKDPSGWGCAAVLPDAKCTGATRPALGEPTCVPIGDCNAGGAYPPPTAIVVDPSLADSALDATHVKTLPDAIAAANDGATIALVDGEHVAPFVNVTKNVTIIGRCAEKAKLVPDSGTGGMRVLSRVNVRNVTVSGMDTAFELYGTSAAFEIEDAVVEASRGRAIFPRNEATARMRRVVVRGTVARTTGAQTIAVLVGSGAALEIEDSAITDSFDGAIAATDAAPARVTMKRSVVDGSTNIPVRVFEGAKLEMEESVVRNGHSIGVLVLHQKTGTPEVALTRSVVTGIEPIPDRPDEDIGVGVNAAYGAIAKIEDSTIADTKGIAVYATEKGRVSLTNSVVLRTRENEITSGHAFTASRAGEGTIVSSAIVDSRGLGVGSIDRARVRVERSLVQTIGGARFDGASVGFGVNTASGSTIDLVDCSIVDALEVAVGADGEGTHVTADKLLLSRSSAAKDGEFAHGIIATFGAIIDVRGSILEKQKGACLFYAGGGGAITRSIVRGNGIGAHVQDGSTLSEAESAPETSVAPDLVVTSDVQFVDNASKTGAGEIPLPSFVTKP